MGRKYHLPKIKYTKMPAQNWIPTEHEASPIHSMSITSLHSLSLTQLLKVPALLQLAFIIYCRNAHKIATFSYL